jgi:4'-phosphopantetheinyl transferase
VCVVGADLSRVGCDLEIVEVRSRGFVSDFLTDAEQAYVAAQPAGDEQDAAANLLWSAKESALKVLRTGLRRDTRSVEIAVGDSGRGSGTAGWGRLTMSTTEQTTLSGWWRREGAFLLTVGADRSIEPPEALPGCARLGDASPVHSWVGRPLAPGWSVEPG